MIHVRINLNDLSEFFKQPSLMFITTPLLFLTTIFLISKLFNIQRRRKVFLIDFSCYKPSPTQFCTKERAIKITERYFNSSQAVLDTMRLVLERSGVGDSTYASQGLLKDPPNLSLEEARKEAESTMFGAIDQLLAKTGVKCKDIGIIIVNCTLLNLVPCPTSMIVNRYGLDKHVLCYNLTGMGCSAGLVAITLAKQLLQVHHNSYALVYSTEVITRNVYMGEVRSMCIANTLFRIGGAAILLSNRPCDSRIAKYQLLHTVQTNTSNSDKSYKCIHREEDDQGYEGVRISRDLLTVAVKAIESNIATVGHLVLPMSEKLLYVQNYLLRRFHSAKIKPYLPRFNRAVDHVFPHVGGKPILDALQNKLGFSETDIEPSRMTLYRFGNTSSSSVWYALAYAEAKRRIKKGDRLWHLTFGSGFKCNSVIWRALRSVDFEESNPWSDEIDEFPVDLHHLVITDEKLLDPIKS